MATDILTNQSSTLPEPCSTYPKRSCHEYTGSRNLKRESARLKTFRNWAVSFMDPKELAKDGLYFTKIQDIVKCAFCPIEIGCWEEGDIPRNDHKNLSPNCPFLNGQDCGNIPISEDEENDDKDEEESEIPSEDVCGTLGIEIRPFSAPERRKIPFHIDSSNLWRDFEELGVSKINGPVAPCYATYDSRIKTFENWPIKEIQCPKKLAEAGFYYMSFHDNVLCFHCGGGLKNWEAEDDPWVEHARWFSKCGFVILQKGREFINEVVSKKRAFLTAEAMREIINNSDKNPKIHQSGEKSIMQNETSNSSASTSASSTPPTSPSTNSNFCSTNSTSNSGRQKSKNSDVEELELCRICYTRERGVVFLPCGHFVSCTQCAPSLSTCAVCRKPFEAMIRAYLS